ncbi:MAG: SMC family ATPase [Chloroflexi bacterium]|nr:SMC family ATPase [Chloroflexota bacterium]
MIPLSLTVENFKCYRRNVPTLYLEGVHIACLCGPNGHGKSSLLDAIAWALWGEAVHRPQEELVHLGEQDMRVELEFAAGGTHEGQGHGQRYRVIRRYTRGGRARAGATSLELQVAAREGEGTGQFRGISGNSVRETEATIRRLVSMDYQTFVNSAFLVQGRADAFTTKTPAERQRVLGEILGLGLYDRLQELAKDKARERAGEIQRIQGQLQAWSQELAQRPPYQEELPRIEADLKRARGNLAESEQEVAALREKTLFLRARQQEYEGLGKQKETAREELEQLRQQASQHSHRVREWDLVVARETEIAQAFARWAELRKRDQELARMVEPHAMLQERKRLLVQRTDAIPSLQAALADEQKRLASLEQREGALQAQRAQLEEIGVRGQTLRGENQRLRQEMDGLRAKFDMLSQGGARCPLCGTELGEDGKAHIAREYEAQGKTLAQQYRQNESLLRALEPRHQELEGVARKAEVELASGRRQLHGRIATLTRQVDEAREASAEVKTVQRRLEALGYDLDAHQGVKTALEELAWSEDQHRLLRQAVEGLPRERENLGRVTALAKRRDDTITHTTERMAAIRQEVEALPATERQLEALETRRRALHEQEQGLVKRHGFLEARLQELRETERMKAEAEALVQTLSLDREMLIQLAAAFGRTGVQALLVEAAIPDLEAEANILLGRMTDNTMHLKLETQRETQRGEPVETLEIKVSDILGTRSYETFSGGEAFRINLALRIALSKLLAHRAGAPLPTLFIDEGFGTQDAAGRERILDVIQSIASDFQRILVITHMDEVKDAFPVRIEVQKTAEGSTFAIT